VTLYIHCPIRLHGVVLTGTTLHLLVCWIMLAAVLNYSTSRIIYTYYSYVIYKSTSSSIFLQAHIFMDADSRLNPAPPLTHTDNEDFTIEEWTSILLVTQ
jgi:hypothetical protein